CEVSSEISRIHAAGIRQLFDPGVVGKISGPETYHVISGHLVAFARDIDAPQFAAARRRVDHGAERRRVEYSVLHRNHRARSAGHQISDRGVTEVARVFGIVGDGRGAAQFVADGLINDRHFDAAVAEPRLDLAFDFAAQVYFGHADVSLRVAIDVF